MREGGREKKAESVCVRRKKEGEGIRYSKTLKER